MFTFNKYKHIRSIKKFLIFPKKQLKYALFHFLIVCFSVLTVNFFSYLKLKNLMQFNVNPQTQNMLLDYLYSNTLITLITMAVIGPLTFLIVIIYLHRFVGPIIPIQKHLGEIIEGNYGSKTHSRKYDEITEVVEKLNEASRVLREKHHLEKEIL